MTTGSEPGRAAREAANDAARPAARALESRAILGMRVDVTTYEDAAERITAWAEQRTPRYVCVANVHMTMETFDDPAFRQTVNGADLVTPDGMPLVWALRSLGIDDASRVYGPTLVLHIAETAAREGVSLFLYGGTEQSVQDFQAFLEQRYPGLNVAGSIAPPFRPLTDDEDAEHTRRIVESGAGIVLVGLGCPKQEKWMRAHTARIPAVLVGVGAAFDFHSGRVRQAPPALQRAGLEWAFRFAMEPKRLWRRYVRHNPRFVALFARQWLRSRLNGARA